jgi:hypothetical protein
MAPSVGHLRPLPTPKASKVPLRLGGGSVTAAPPNPPTAAPSAASYDPADRP